jgi:hypothetical protein
MEAEVEKEMVSGRPESESESSRVMATDLGGQEEAK